MAIDLRAGEIYFIGEKDVRTNQSSSYYKIGLVREKDDRDVVCRRWRVISTAPSQRRE